MTLPQAGEGFEWVDTAGGPALVCRPLGRSARHLFTTRSWSLGSPATAIAGAAWREVSEAVEVAPADLRRVHQVHGADVVVHHAGDSAPAGLTRADIIVSDDPQGAVAVQTADCVPLLIADVRTGASAAAHAGWRGTALSVAAVAVKALASQFNCRPMDLVAAIGPAIGPCCYQVGSEVSDRFRAAGFSDADLARWFLTSPRSSTVNRTVATFAGHANADRRFLDLWTATADQLKSAGMAHDRIFVAALCTASHEDMFCSYRRDGARAGRLAAVISPRRIL